jgi:hypothetical protein
MSRLDWSLIIIVAIVLLGAAIWGIWRDGGL